jgi:DNA-directed RNA polymerase specialized sigma24 family protein
MVFETNGRPSDEAVAFVRSYGHGLSQADRAEVVGTAWRQISRTLQIGNAEMVLSANG